MTQILFCFFTRDMLILVLKPQRKVGVPQITLHTCSGSYDWMISFGKAFKYKPATWVLYFVSSWLKCVWAEIFGHCQKATVLDQGKQTLLICDGSHSTSCHPLRSPNTYRTHWFSFVSSPQCSHPSWPTTMDSRHRATLQVSTHKHSANPWFFAAGFNGTAGWLNAEGLTYWAESQRLLCDSPTNKPPDLLRCFESQRFSCLRYLCAVWSLPTGHRQHADWGSWKPGNEWEWQIYLDFSEHRRPKLLFYLILSLSLGWFAFLICWKIKYRKGLHTVSPFSLNRLPELLFLIHDL